MTREKAHRILSNGLVNAPSEHEWCMAFEMAIKALEQEPCEDAISRQAVKEQMIKYGFHAPDMTITEFIEDELPSVVIPSVEPYKGMTNVEVVKAIFPNIPRTLEWHIQNVTDDDWWYSPYEPQERSE